MTMTNLITMTTKSQYQCECPECHCDIWHTGERYLHCPHCGKKLNEASSEDADDGQFLPSPGSKEWAVYSMQHGEKVTNPKLPCEYIFMTCYYQNGKLYGELDIAFENDGGIYDYVEDMWIDDGWEIYQPKGDTKCLNQI